GHFAVDNVLRRLPFDELSRQQFDVLQRLNAAADGVIYLGKVRKVAEDVPFAHAVHVRRRKLDAIALRQFQQRLRPGRALKMDVKLNFGHRPDEVTQCETHFLSISSTICTASRTDGNLSCQSNAIGSFSLGSTCEV